MNELKEAVKLIHAASLKISKNPHYSHCAGWVCTMLENICTMILNIDARL